MSMQRKSQKWIMDHNGWTASSCVGLALALLGPLANAAPAATSPGDVAESIRHWQALPARPYRLRGADRRLLDRAQQFAADGHWEDALSAVMRLLAADQQMVVPIDRKHVGQPTAAKNYRSNHYESLRNYCHRLLTQFPPEILGRYRRLVEVSSKSWYEQGLAARDTKLLQRVVDEAFCSHWGDDALLALGELALERGDYQAARNAWRQICRQQREFAEALAYPDTELAPATVLARLALVSLREGDWQRAQRELAELREVAPTAMGRLGGRQVVLIDHLSAMLLQARRWPRFRLSTEWPTFAATPQRTNTAESTELRGPCELLWSQPLENQRLQIFPVVAKQSVIYQDDKGVCARSLTDGRKEFAVDGDVFQLPISSTLCLGQPWRTLTATNHQVFGVTTAPLGRRPKSDDRRKLSTCWGIDLKREGALAVQISSDDTAVAFVGAPLVIGDRVWLACRGNDQTARAGIACYSLTTQQRIWQRWVCQANTPATGWTQEWAMNLLTYDAGVLYFSTNLGAIAAVRADDGHLLWLRTYQRQNVGLRRGGKSPYYRGAGHCIYYRGMVIAHPNDSAALVAYDAGTGSELWQVPVDDPQAQLVGASGGVVVVSNGGLQVFDCLTGELKETNTEAELVGWPVLRGADPARDVLWPRQGWVDVLELSGGGPQDNGFKLPEPNGANLLVAGNYLVVAARSQLSVYRCETPSVSPPRNSQTSLKE